MYVCVCVSVCVCSRSPQLLFLQVLNVIFVENETDLCLHLLSFLNRIHNHIVTLRIRKQTNVNGNSKNKGHWAESLRLNMSAWSMEFQTLDQGQQPLLSKGQILPPPPVHKICLELQNISDNTSSKCFIYSYCIHTKK